MTNRQFPSRALYWSSVALFAGIVTVGATQAHATNLLNMYVGAAYSRANLRAKDSNPVPFLGSGPLNSFSRSDSGYQFTLGVRALESLGAEIDYFDLGTGHVSNAYDAQVNPGSVTDATLGQKGEAAFAMLYLPIPVIDVYLKAGIDRVTSDLGARFNAPLALCLATNCPSLNMHTTTTGLALGAGAQWQFGNWGVRADYERLTALGGHPDLISVGVIWTFL